MMANAQQTNQVNLGDVLPLLIMTLAPAIEARTPGAGVGMAGGALSFLRSRQERARQDADRRGELLIQIARDLAQIDDEHLNIAIPLYENAVSGFGPEFKGLVKTAAQASRAFRQPKSAVEQAFDDFAKDPTIAQSLAMGKLFPNLPPQSLFTPEQVRTLRGRFPQFPLDVRTDEVVVGTRPETVTEEKRTPFPASMITGTGPGLARIPSERVQSSQVTRQVPVTQPQERIVVRGAVEQAVPTFADLWTKAAGQPIGSLKVPLDPRTGLPDLGQASEIANRLGFIEKPEDLQKQRDRHQVFLRDKLVAGLSIPGSVHLPTLQGQMQALGMNWPAELVRARQVVNKASAEEPVEMTVDGKTFVVSQAQAMQIAEQRQRDAATRKREEERMIAVPELGNRKLTPSEFIAWLNFGQRRAEFAAKPRGGGKEDKLTPAQRGQLWQEAYQRARDEVLGPEFTREGTPSPEQIAQIEQRAGGYFAESVRVSTGGAPGTSTAGGPTGGRVTAAVIQSIKQDAQNDIPWEGEGGVREGLLALGISDPKAIEVARRLYEAERKTSAPSRPSPVKPVAVAPAGLNFQRAVVAAAHNQQPFPEAMLRKAKLTPVQIEGLRRIYKNAIKQRR